MKIAAEKNKRLEFDRNGFFIIIVDRDKCKIVVEHYQNVERGKVLGTGRLDKIIEGTNAEEICHTIINQGFVSRLEHAAYLGRELQKAETALKNKLPYGQDEELNWEG